MMRLPSKCGQEVAHEILEEDDDVETVNGGGGGVRLGFSHSQVNGHNNRYADENGMNQHLPDSADVEANIRPQSTLTMRMMSGRDETDRMAQESIPPSDDPQTPRIMTTTSSNVNEFKADPNSPPRIDTEKRMAGLRSEEELLLASALINDAKDCVHSDYKTDPTSLRHYLIYRHSALQFINQILLIVLHLTAIKSNYDSGTVNERDDTQMRPLILTVELICLSCFSLRLIQLHYILPRVKFWRDTKNLILGCVILITFIDILISVIMSHVNDGRGFRYVRFSPVIRPLMVINFAENKQIRRAIRNIRHTLPEVIKVLILLFAVIAVFAVIGLKLFDKQSLKSTMMTTANMASKASGATSSSASRPLNGTLNEPYFTNYFDIYYQLYILVTTANNPDIMMPAYNRNRWYAIYFITYLCINLYLFMNIILAVIYNNYRKHLKGEVEQLIAMRKLALRRAYSILTTGRDNLSSETDQEKEINNEQGISYDQLTDILNYAVFHQSRSSWLYSFWDQRKIYEDPRSREALVNLYWSLLSVDGQIPCKRWQQLADLLQLDISIVENSGHRKVNSFARFFPNIYGSRVSRAFRRSVVSKKFRYVFDALILLNAILIAAEYDSRPVEYFLLTAFTFEIIAKIYTFGFLPFMTKFWNVFDALVIGAAIIFTILQINGSHLDKWVDLLLIFRILRLCKIIGTIKRFKLIVMTISSLLPSIVTYVALLLLVFYSYAILGVLLFNNAIREIPASSCTSEQQMVNCCPPDQDPRILYCTINFNSFMNAMVFLFDLMVVNQWHVLAYGVELGVGSRWPRLFFVSFHLCCVLLVLNILTAFVIEAFILEYLSVTQSGASKSSSKGIKSQVSSNDLYTKLQDMGLNWARSRAQTLERPDSKRNSKDDEMDLVDADHDDNRPSMSHFASAFQGNQKKNGQVPGESRVDEGDGANGSSKAPEGQAERRASNLGWGLQDLNFGQSITISTQFEDLDIVITMKQSSEQFLMRMFEKEIS